MNSPYYRPCVTVKKRQTEVSEHLNGSSVTLHTPFPVPMYG